MALRNGRLKKAMSSAFVKLNSSINFDWRLAPYDIQGSIAYTRALYKAGILTSAESKSIITGLESIKEEITKGKFKFREEDEDVHMNIERRLHELIGENAYKLHTGRSRNEQIVLDERLFLIDVSSLYRKKLLSLMQSLAETAKRSIHVIAPSYTHMQQAQPIRLAHLFLSYYHAFHRDVDRLLDYQKRLRILPLGSGAVAGSTIGIDRELLLKELPFESLSQNSIDAVSARDFILEFLFIAISTMLILSRMAEDLIIYSTAEFGFVILSDDVSTTSSLMPQKKNPDSLELIRAKCARVIGNLSALTTLLKGLPSSYDRDLQEDKPPLFDTADTVLLCIDVMHEVLSGLTIDNDRINEVLNKSKDFLFATDIAEYLVQKGVPFRNAHKIMGEIVQHALSEKKQLSELNIEDYRKFSDAFDKDLYAIFDYAKSADRHDVPGGTARRRIEEELYQIEEELKTITNH